MPRRIERRKGLGRLFSPRVEPLERRDLLSVSPSAPVLDFQSLTTDVSEFDPSRILVKFRDEGSAASLFKGTSIGDSFDLVPGLREVHLAPGTSVDEAVLAYQGSPSVEYAMPDYTVRLSLTPNDPSFGSLYGLHNVGQSGGTADADIDAPEAWDVSTGSSSMVVAVIDTGIDYNHPDLFSNIWVNQGEIPGNSLDDDGNGFIDDVHGYDFVNNDGDPMDDNSHGTHVAGTIGAIGNNGVGVVGVNWNVKMMALKFLSAGGSGSTSNAVRALDYAVAEGAKITNNSWGGGGFSSALSDAITRAQAAGQIFVAAAGNSNNNNDLSPFYPANYSQDNVVAVAASDRNDLKASFSSYGATTVDLAAPGVSILSTTPGNTYSFFNGTSMATPHVAGAMALVWSIHPEWTYRQVIDQVLNTVDPLPAFAGITVTGGRLNVGNAMGGAPPSGGGPRVTRSTPVGAVTGSVYKLEFLFDKPLNASSVSKADVFSFTGPGGTNQLSKVTSVNVSGSKLTVNFTSRTTLGTYTMVIGPDIFDTTGNPMNQDGDSDNGENPDDRYTAVFSINSKKSFTNSTDFLINDLSTTVSTINVGQDFNIADVNVRVTLTHTYDEDLILDLVSPDGTTVNLANRRGGSGDNYKTTTFNDEALTPISAGAAPFNGNFMPEQSLTVYDGRNARGLWQLRINDVAAQDTGLLQSWSIDFAVGTGSAGDGDEGGDVLVAAMGDDSAGWLEAAAREIRQSRAVDVLRALRESPRLSDEEGGPARFVTTASTLDTLSTGAIREEALALCDDGRGPALRLAARLVDEAFVDDDRRDPWNFELDW
jgi:subtilisin family serine protease